MTLSLEQRVALDDIATEIEHKVDDLLEHCFLEGRAEVLLNDATGRMRVRLLAIRVEDR